MNGSPQESKQDRIKRFQRAIHQKWQCEASHNRDQFCDLSYAKGWASVYDLSKHPKEHPEANQCCVWDGKDFKPGENEVVTVLDVQVTSDPKDLPFWAVWTWWTESLVDDRLDNYVESKESKKWTKAQLLELHNERVEFGLNKTAGNFFVRERADGKVSVRIVWDVTPNLKVRTKDWTHNSIPLGQSAIERIERPLPDSNLHSLIYP